MQEKLSPLDEALLKIAEKQKDNARIDEVFKDYFNQVGSIIDTQEY